MIHILAILLSIAGFACLCAAMPRHQRDFVGHTLDADTARRSRTAGFALLAAALVVSTAGLGLAYGLIAAFGHMTLAAALVVTRLNYVKARR